MRMRILGIDPGLRTTGYGAIEIADGRMQMLAAGVITSQASSELEQRLAQLHGGIARIVSQTRPDAIVIEELYTTYKNPLTAILMGHARGVLCLAGAQAGVPVHTLTHSLVKRALIGNGAAAKEQVSRMVTQLLGLREAIAPHDTSDALALALAFANIREHDRRLPAALRRTPA